MELTHYKDLEISEKTKKAIADLGFEKMTEVQQKAIPPMMEGKDIVVKAPTGTGKTFAFGVPLVEKADPEATLPQFLILSPTRELAVQIHDEIVKLTKYLPSVRSVVLYGGAPIHKQIVALKKRPQIIVATPGRMLDHIKRRTVKLSQIQTVVLDEADEMLDMGFFKDVCKIIDQVPENKQLALFSATISREVMDLMWLYQREDTIEITVTPDKESEPKITQYSLECSGYAKVDYLIRILRLYDYQRVIVFSNTRRGTEMIRRRLAEKKFPVEALSSDVNQKRRNQIMKQFKAHSLQVLVTTDVAARGIDVSDVDAVFNFDVPQDNTSYLHRIGRTGRAKKEGVSFIFYTSTEIGRMKEIIRYTKSNIIPLRFSEGGILEPLPESEYPF